MLHQYNPKQGRGDAFVRSTNCTHQLCQLICQEKKLLKGDALSGDDVREGLVAVKVKYPDFSSQTKDKLVSSEVTGIVQTIVYDKLGEFFEENPSVAKQIVEKAYLHRKLEATRKARDLTRRKVLEGGGLPVKLWTVNPETRANVRYT